MSGIIRNLWKKYYFLTAKDSIKKFCIDQNDRLYIENAEGQSRSVELVDQLHLDRYLLLYFINARPSKRNFAIREPSTLTNLILKVKGFPLNLKKQVL